MLNTIIEKVIALITAIITALFGLNLVEPFYIENPDITIIENDFGSHDFEGYNIISSYSELLNYCKINNSEKTQEYSSNYDREFFVHNALIIVDVLLADSGKKVFVTSANQVNNEINLEYVKVSDSSVGLTAIYHSSICITAKKPVTKVNITQMNKIHLPFLLNSELYPFADIIEITNEPNSAKTTFFFNSYSDWQAYSAENDIIFSEIPKYIDEEYFKNNNLGIIITSVPDSSHEIRITEFYPYEENVHVDYYSVSQPKIGLDSVFYNAILIKTSKETKSITATENQITIPFNLDGTLPN